MPNFGMNLPDHFADYTMSINEQNHMFTSANEELTSLFTVTKEQDIGLNSKRLSTYLEKHMESSIMEDPRSQDNLDGGIENAMLTFADARRNSDLIRNDGIAFEYSRTSLDLPGTFNPLKPKSSQQSSL